MQSSERKILFTSHVAGFARFNYPYMRWFKKQGWIVHYASQGEKVIDCDCHYKIPFNRSPFSLNNIKAYIQLKNILKTEKYDIIHCHTPMGGVVTRLAAKKVKAKNTKVIYTAHGFHFYKGAPIINWLLYCTVEKYLSRYTDCLITINNEDYDTATRKKFRARHIFKINGVGANLDRFSPVSSERKALMRQEYDFSENAFVLICVAEFTINKNQAFLIRAMKGIIKQIPNAKLVFAGTGENIDSCRKLYEELNLTDSVIFLGYRQDMPQLYQISDVLVSASKREGLPVNLLEGMASGLQVVCTNIRGHNDVIEHNRNGYLFKYGDMRTYENCIINLYNDKNKRESISLSNIKGVQAFSLENALNAMEKIYKQFMG